MHVLSRYLHCRCLVRRDPLSLRLLDHPLHGSKMTQYEEYQFFLHDGHVYACTHPRHCSCADGRKLAAEVSGFLARLPVAHNMHALHLCARGATVKLISCPINISELQQATVRGEDSGRRGKPPQHRAVRVTCIRAAEPMCGACGPACSTTGMFIPTERCVPCLLYCATWTYVRVVAGLSLLPLSRQRRNACCSTSTAFMWC